MFFKPVLKMFYFFLFCYNEIWIIIRSIDCMDYILKIKPHHLLDYLYDLAINNRHDEPNITGSRNGELCRDFMDGKVDKIIFTPFVDDICKPCKKLENGVKCTDIFDDETTKYYGYRSKHDFNYQLDIKLNEALPNVFVFEKEQDISEVLEQLKRYLTNDIINLYLWKRPDREKNTFSGIEKALTIYRNNN